jgi:hypothetical protein
MTFPGILRLFALSPRPVLHLSSGLCNRVDGEEVIPSKEESDAGSVSRFTPPDLSKKPECKPPSFCFIRSSPVRDQVTQ